MNKITAVVSFAFLLASSAHAELDSLQPTVSFSAWRVMTAGDTLIEGPYHYAPGKHRSEITMGGQTFIAIVREDRELLWTVMPQQNMYMEVTFDAAEAGNGSAFEGADVVESRELGTEDVNGHRTTKYEVTIRDRTGETATGTLWATAERIPVKMDMALDRGERVVIELRDIEIGPQSNDLFEVPAGYTRLALGNLGNLAGAFQGMIGNPAAEPAPGGSNEADNPNFAEEVAQGAAEAAREGVTEGVRQGVRENVGRRIRGIFNR